MVGPHLFEYDGGVSITDRLLVPFVSRAFLNDDTLQLPLADDNRETEQHRPTVKREGIDSFNGVFLTVTVGLGDDRLAEEVREGYVNGDLLQRYDGAVWRV